MRQTGGGLSQGISLLVFLMDGRPAHANVTHANMLQAVERSGVPLSKLFVVYTVRFSLLRHDLDYRGGSRVKLCNPFR